jgi:hypothetical protein
MLPGALALGLLALLFAIMCTIMARSMVARCLGTRVHCRDAGSVDIEVDIQYIAISTLWTPHQGLTTPVPWSATCE